MYALFIEVTAGEEHKERAREMLNPVAVPGARDAGAKLGVWLEPMNGQGISITGYATEEEARDRPKASLSASAPSTTLPRA